MTPMPRNAWSLILKTAWFSLLVPVTVVAVLPALWLAYIDQRPAPHSDGLSLTALLLMGLGILGYLGCARDFILRGQGTPSPFAGPRVLLSGGFYRRTRNPMFLAVLLVLFAEALLFRSLELLAYALGVALLLHSLVVFFEEPRLKRRFGSQYAEYCRRVSRWGLGGR